MRCFEEVRKEFKKFPNVETKLPERATTQSAGYDFYSKEDFVVAPGGFHMTWTDVKAKMFFDNVLEIYTRSGNGIKRGIILKNNVGIIDSDYYSNVDNDGNIGIGLLNTGNEPFEVHIGDRIAQGIFTRYLIVSDDKFKNKKSIGSRDGGFGSSGR